MAETTENVKSTSEIPMPEVAKNLEALGNGITKIVKSEEYKNLLKEVDSIQKAILEDDEKIKKEGKSDYTYEQKALMKTELNSLASLDAAFGSLIGIIGMRYHEEVEIAAYKLAAETEAAEKADK